MRPTLTPYFSFSDIPEDGFCAYHALAAQLLVSSIEGTNSAELFCQSIRNMLTAYYPSKEEEEINEEIQRIQRIIENGKRKIQSKQKESSSEERKFIAQYLIQLHFYHREQAVPQLIKEIEQRTIKQGGEFLLKEILSSSMGIRTWYTYLNDEKQAVKDIKQRVAKSSLNKLFGPQSQGEQKITEEFIQKIKENKENKELLLELIRFFSRCDYTQFLNSDSQSTQNYGPPAFLPKDDLLLARDSGLYALRPLATEVRFFMTALHLRTTFYHGSIRTASGIEQDSVYFVPIKNDTTPSYSEYYQGRQSFFHLTVSQSFCSTPPRIRYHLNQKTCTLTMSSKWGQKTIKIPFINQDKTDNESVGIEKEKLSKIALVKQSDGWYFLIPGEKDADTKKVCLIETSSAEFSVTLTPDRDDEIIQALGLKPGDQIDDSPWQYNSDYWILVPEHSKQNGSLFTQLQDKATPLDLTNRELNKIKSSHYFLTGAGITLTPQGPNNAHYSCGAGFFNNETKHSNLNSISISNSTQKIGSTTSKKDQSYSHNQDQNQLKKKIPQQNSNNQQSAHSVPSLSSSNPPQSPIAPQSQQPNNPPQSNTKLTLKEKSQKILQLDEKQAISYPELLNNLTQQDIENCGSAKEMLCFLETTCMTSIFSLFTTPKGKGDLMSNSFLCGKPASFFFFPIIPALKIAQFVLDILDWVKELREEGFKAKSFLRILLSFVKTVIISVAILLPMLLPAVAVATPYLFLSIASLDVIEQMGRFFLAPIRYFLTKSKEDARKELYRGAQALISCIASGLFAAATVSLFIMVVTNPVGLAVCSCIGVAATVIMGILVAKRLYQKSKKKLTTFSKLIAIKDILDPNKKKKEKAINIATDERKDYKSFFELIGNRKPEEKKQLLRDIINIELKNNPRDQEKNRSYANNLITLRWAVELGGEPGNTEFLNPFSRAPFIKLLQMDQCSKEQKNTLIQFRNFYLKHIQNNNKESNPNPPWNSSIKQPPPSNDNGSSSLTQSL